MQTSCLLALLLSVLCVSQHASATPPTTYDILTNGLRVKTLVLGTGNVSDVQSIPAALRGLSSVKRDPLSGAAGNPVRELTNTAQSDSITQAPTLSPTKRPTLSPTRRPPLSGDKLCDPLFSTCTTTYSDWFEHKFNTLTTDEAKKDSMNKVVVNTVTTDAGMVDTLQGISCGTWFYLAAQQDKFDQVDYIVNNFYSGQVPGSSVDYTSISDSRLFTALQWAAYHGRTEGALLLLANGADGSRRDVMNNMHAEELARARRHEQTANAIKTYMRGQNSGASSLTSPAAAIVVTSLLLQKAFSA